MTKRSRTKAGKTANAEQPSVTETPRAADALSPEHQAQRAAIDAAFASRERKAVNPPTEPLTHTIVEAVGPNVDGLTHLVMLATTTDDDERALVAADLESRHTAKE